MTIPFPDDTCTALQWSEVRGGSHRSLMLFLSLSCSVDKKLRSTLQRCDMAFKGKTRRLELQQFNVGVGTCLNHWAISNSNQIQIHFVYSSGTSFAKTDMSIQNFRLPAHASILAGEVGLSPAGI